MSYIILFSAKVNMNSRPEFSIVTPSFNMLGYLQKCAASVADQQDVSYEHLVMDGGSTDGTAEWLQEQDGLAYLSEKDDGMYDALNKGFRGSRGEILAYLNCDEQYLPGTLSAVRDHFRQNPSADIVFGGALLVNPDGELLAYRKAYPPRLLYILTDHLYLLSCTMFMRRKVVDRGFSFDTSYRAVGDGDLVIRLLDAEFRAIHIPKYLSVFTMTGANMSEGENALREQRTLRARAPTWARACRPILTLCRRMEKLAHGAYRETWPLSYAIYTDASAPRKRFSAESASPRWEAAVGK